MSQPQAIGSAVFTQLNTQTHRLRYLQHLYSNRSHLYTACTWYGL